MGEDVKTFKSMGKNKAELASLPRPKDRNKSLKLVLRPFDANANQSDFDVAMIGVSLRRTTDGLSVVMMPNRVRS